MMSDPSNIDTPIYKLVNRKWKQLPSEGGSVGINDPKIKDGYLGDLTQKTVIQLEELLNRQDKILNNEEFISKLKDRGKKLSERREEFRAALEMVRNNTIPPLRQLIQPDAIAAYEWSGKLNSEENKNLNTKPTQSENEELEKDPLQLIASHSIDTPAHCSSSHDGDIDDDPTLIIEKELAMLNLQDELDQSCSQNYTYSEKEDFGSKTLRSLEEKEKKNIRKRAPFKPFKLKKPWQPNEEGKKSKCLWEESSATGVVSSMRETPVHMIPLKESLILQKQHQTQQKDRQLIEAASHLSRIKGVSIDLSSNTFDSSLFNNYRDTNIEKHILEDTDDEDDLDIHGGLKLVRSTDEAY